MNLPSAQLTGIVSGVRVVRVAQLVTKVPRSTDLRLVALGSPWLILVVRQENIAGASYRARPPHGPRPPRGDRTRATGSEAAGNTSPPDL